MALELVVVEVGHQVVADGAGDGAEEHRHPDASGRPVVPRQEQGREALAERPQRLLLGGEAGEDRVGLDAAEQEALLDEDGDEAVDDEFDGHRPRGRALGGVEGHLEGVEGTPPAAPTISSSVRNWWYRGLRHAEGVGDHLQGGAGDALLGEQRQGGVDHARLSEEQGRVDGRGRRVSRR